MNTSVFGNPFLESFTVENKIHLKCRTMTVNEKEASRTCVTLVAGLNTQ